MGRGGEMVHVARETYTTEGSTTELDIRRYQRGERRSTRNLRDLCSHSTPGLGQKW